MWWTANCCVSEGTTAYTECLDKLFRPGHVHCSDTKACAEGCMTCSGKVAECVVNLAALLLSSVEGVVPIRANACNAA